MRAMGISEVTRSAAHFNKNSIFGNVHKYACPSNQCIRSLILPQVFKNTLRIVLLAAAL